MLERLILLALIILACVIPGLFAITFIKGPTRTKLLLVPFLSLSFYICLIGITSYLHLPYSWGCLITTTGFAVGVFCRHKYLPIVKWTSLSKEDLFLGLASLYYLLPFFVRNLPAGKDSTMQGYVSWLIIDWNNLPNSYEPIFPIDDFGSFSSGLSTISAVFSAFTHEYLHLGLLFISLFSYVLCLLAFLLFFRQFFSYRTALIVSIIISFCSRIPQDSFGWGGNSTVLAFSFAVAFSAIILQSFKETDKRLFVTSGIVLAAIPLTHLIPAATLLYLAVVGVAVLIYQHPKTTKKFLLPTVLLLVVTTALILPLILKIDPITEQVTERIRLWQSSMGPDFTEEGFISDINAVFAMIKYRIGDALFTVLLVSILFLFFMKLNWKEKIHPVLFIFVIFLLIWNSNYWILPGSAILYPERVVFFILLPFGFYIGRALEGLEKPGALNVKKRAVLKYAFYLLAFLSPLIGLKYFGKTAFKKEATKEYFEAFNWINNNLPSNAVFKTNYNGLGVWLPMMTGRTTEGAHLHFIHAHVQKELALIPDKYYFISPVDISGPNQTLLPEVAEKELIFQNEKVRIYH